MKFLIDENIGVSIVKMLQKEGYDTKSVSEYYPAYSDIEVLEIAAKEERIIITNDKDFGYLIFKSGFPSVPTILLRFEDENPSLKLNAIKTILGLPEEKILNHFIVASENKIRIRPLSV